MMHLGVELLLFHLLELDMLLHSSFTTLSLWRE
jgi:hypothetical protein